MATLLAIEIGLTVFGAYLLYRVIRFLSRSLLFLALVPLVILGAVSALFEQGYLGRFAQLEAEWAAAGSPSSLVTYFAEAPQDAALPDLLVVSSPAHTFVAFAAGILLFAFVLSSCRALRERFASAKRRSEGVIA